MTVSQVEKFRAADVPNILNAMLGEDWVLLASPSNAAARKAKIEQHGNKAPDIKLFFSI